MATTVVTKDEEERQARANMWAQEGTQPEGRSKRKVLVVHGAGMCMRGKTQIEKFGPLTLADYERHIVQYAEQHNLDIEFFGSNSEGSVIDRLYAAHDEGDVDGAIINPGGTRCG
jgi:3-dehydroquinate dehydratase